MRFIEDYKRHKFDPNYLELLPRIHGGVPKKAWFTAENGADFRIGRFLTLVDDQSELPSPSRPSWEFPERDMRIDWSILTLIDDDGPSCHCFYGGERLLPFAALCSDQFGLSDGMGIGEYGILDLLCFFYEAVQNPPQIVVALAMQAFEEYRRWEATHYDEVRYDDFTIRVAPHFDAFRALLREER